MKLLIFWLGNLKKHFENYFTLTKKNKRTALFCFFGKRVGAIVGKLYCRYGITTVPSQKTNSSLHFDTKKLLSVYISYFWVQIETIALRLQGQN